ncbi:DUF6265 family protein [Candidatus Viadribacter manganicus]|uniref:DUF6265 domain-containing protein n=1 Tax=Candidatus Viadribacter manganicus TaxID=1759059 RepID=A0A1B1AEN2_9PROT|nr:DUF6265 family protein [Candidatus Viadribacter manganicus]ANP45026.1 hypothetical protein ATE48_03365 [Candidatus Viadribacter manganicus]
MRLVLFFAALLFAPAAFAQDVSDLRWLRGCWQTEPPREAESGATFTEVWIAPEAPIILGYDYHEGEGEIQGWSQMRIESNGAPELVDMPLGSFPIRYRLMDEEVDNHVSFQNLEHDFPQRIEYRREGNRLYRRISNGGVDAQEFIFHRIRCPASLRP